MPILNKAWCGRHSFGIWDSVDVPCAKVCLGATVQGFYVSHGHALLLGILSERSAKPKNTLGDFEWEVIFFAGFTLLFLVLQISDTCLWGSAKSPKTYL